MTTRALPPCVLGLDGETLSAWRDGLLLADESRRIARHTPGCASCQREPGRFRDHRVAAEWPARALAARGGLGWRTEADHGWRTAQVFHRQWAHLGERRGGHRGRDAGRVIRRAVGARTAGRAARQRDAWTHHDALPDTHAVYWSHTYRDAVSSADANAAGRNAPEADPCAPTPPPGDDTNPYTCSSQRLRATGLDGVLPAWRRDRCHVSSSRRRSPASAMPARQGQYGRHLADQQDDGWRRYLEVPEQPDPDQRDLLLRHGESHQPNDVLVNDGSPFTNTIMRSKDGGVTWQKQRRRDAGVPVTGAGPARPCWWARFRRRARNPQTALYKSVNGGRFV